MNTDTSSLNMDDLDDLIDCLGLANNSSSDDDGFDDETFLDTYGSDEWCEKQRKLLDEDEMNLAELDEMSVEEFDKVQSPTFHTILGIIGWIGVCDRMLEMRQK